MERLEIINLIGICSINYRNWPEPGKEEALVALWQSMLSDVDFEVAKMAVQKYMLESVYPPTVADIRSRVTDFTVKREKSGIEAWGEVKEAIRRFGWPEQQKALASLSGPTRKVVESMGYQELCKSENDMADRAHFLKVYETVAKRDREDALLLPEMRTVLNRLETNKQFLLEGEGA